MFNALRRLPRSIVASCFLCVLATTVAPCRAADAPAVDPQVQALIDKYLRVDPQYKPGDILSRTEVEPIYNDILSRGLKPTGDSESAFTPVLRESSFLVQLLRTPKGRELMRKIADKPHAYDKLDRLSWLPGGEGWVKQIVESPEGPELLERIFTDEGVAAMQKKFADDPRAQTLKLPTGKIYTEADLGAALTKAIRKQMQKKQPTAKPQPAQEAKSGGAKNGGTTSKSSKSPAVTKAN